MRMYCLPVSKRQGSLGSKAWPEPFFFLHHMRRSKQTIKQHEPLTTLSLVVLYAGNESGSNEHGFWKQLIKGKTIFFSAKQVMTPTPGCSAGQSLSCTSCCWASWVCVRQSAPASSTQWCIRSWKSWVDDGCHCHPCYSSILSVDR